MKTIVTPVFKNAYIVAILLLTILFNNNLTAQNTGPNNPDAMGFEPATATDMVNLLTGDFVYTLPLFELPGPTGNYPITLSYHGGVPVNAEASWVGLGWSLTPGSINRSINGVPDDSRGRIITHSIYDSGEEVKSSFIGISQMFPGGEVGIGLSWASNRSLNGYVNVSIGVGDFGIGLSSSGELSLGYKNARMVLSGSGLQIGIRSQSPNKEPGEVSGSVGVNFSYSEKPSLYAGAKYQLTKSSSLSLGVSKNGINISAAIDGFQVQVATSSMAPTGIYNVERGGWRAGIILPTYTSIEFGQSRTRYYYYEGKSKEYYGPLYFEEARKSAPNESQQEKNIGMDVIFINNREEDDLESYGNSILLPAYDAYSVNSNGIGGTISPRLFDGGNLVGHPKTLKYYLNNNGDISSEEEELDYLYRYCPNNCNEHFIYNKDGKTFFHFDYESSSYASISRGSIAWDGSGNDPVWDYFWDGTGILDKEVNIYGPNRQFFDENDNRKGSGNIIHWITNDEIYQQSSLLTSKRFIEAQSSLDKINSEGTRLPNDFAPNGIGAINITTAEGMTYHYSLPVYHFEQFFTQRDLTLFDEDNRVVDLNQHNLEKYATTWLLTAITGPDFVDNPPYNQINEEDLGYWVEFEYGKWSDGYIWRLPYEGWDEVVNTENGHTMGHYTWGRKQIFYLDAIRNKTHTAYFVKGLREDAKSPTIDINEDSKLINHTIQYVEGQTANIYGDLYELTQPLSAAHYSIKLYQQQQYINQNQHKLLRLNNIIIVKREDDCLDFISEEQLISNSPTHMPAGQIHNTAEITSLNTGVSTYGDCIKYLPEEFEYYFDDNICDVNDIAESNIQDVALRTIKLEYDYSLCKNAPGSVGGKLSLKKVYLNNARENISLLPPYTFTYFDDQSYNEYSEELIDEWGFHKLYPMQWSLKGISLPHGSEILVNYESDEYSRIALGRDFQYDYSFSFGCNPLGLDFIIEPNYSSLEDDFIIGENIDITVKLEEKVEDNYGDCHISYTGNETQSFEIISIADNRIYLSPSLESSFGLYENGPCESLHISSIVGINYTNALIRKKGGGLRVKSIAIDDGNAITKTEYSYNNPENGQSSGITSYVPIDGEMFLPYKSEIPAPGVMYEFVTQTGKSQQSNFDMQSTFQFEVLPVIDYRGSDELLFGDILKITQPQPNEEIYQNSTLPHLKHILRRTTQIDDNKSAMGRLLSVTHKNGYEDIIEKRKLHYLPSEQVKLGMIQETFYSRRNRIWWSEDQSSSESVVYLNLVAKKEVPSQLEKITTISGNNLAEELYLERDFKTGKGIKLLRSVNHDNYLLQEVQLAHNLYSRMGSWLENPENKNMLVQEAGNYTYISNSLGDKLGLLGAQVQTWDNNWWYREYENGYYDADPSQQINTQHIWRKKASYYWESEVDNSGVIPYSVEFIYDNPAINEEAGWIKSSEVLRYDHFSRPIESLDVNDLFYSTKYSLNGKYYCSSAIDASYRSQTFTGFESRTILSDGRIDWGGEVISNNLPEIKQMRQENEVIPHTGKYFIKVFSGNHGPLFRATTSDQTSESPQGLQTGRTYRGMIWVHKNSPDDAQLIASINGSLNSTEEYNSYETVRKDDPKNFIAGDWILMTVDLYVPDGYTSINGNGTNDLRFYSSVYNSQYSAYFDDFKVQPLDAEVTGYVYDAEKELLTAELDNYNLGTTYKYDQSDRLHEVFVETKEGFKITNRSLYNFSNLGLKIEPDYIDFGDVILGEYSDYVQVTIVNSSPSGYERNFNINCSNDFEFDAGYTSFHLAPGESTTLLVRFSPQSTGYKDGQLTIYDFTADSEHKIDLKGNCNGDQLSLAINSSHATVKLSYPEEVTFQAEPSGGTGIYSYKWYQCTDGNWNGPYSTSSTYSVMPVDNHCSWPCVPNTPSITVKCVVTDSNGNSASNTFEVSVIC